MINFVGNENKTVMPYQFLSKLCNASLSVTFEDSEDFHKLRVLQVAKLVQANFASLIYATPNVGYASGAVALSMTAEGKLAIKGH